MKKILLIPFALLTLVPGLFAQTSYNSESVEIEVASGPVTITSSQPKTLANASDYKVKIDELDANGDGELSRREIPESHALTHEFHLVDINHNGFITDTELQKANWR